MSKSKLALYLAIIGIIATIVIGFPTWKNYIRDLLFAPGPIYYSQSNQSLRTILEISKIKKNLIGYKFYILKPALGMKLDKGRYVGSGNLRFFRRKMYISLLEDILSRNEDQIEYYINKSDKVVFIWPKNQLEQF